MTIDRAVMAFAGTMILLSLALAYAFSSLLVGARRLRWAKPSAVFVHGLLPVGDGAEASRCASGRGFLN